MVFSKMSTKQLVKAGVDAETASKLARAGLVTLAQVLEQDALFLVARCDLSWAQAQEVIFKVSDKVKIEPTTALELLNKRKSMRNHVPTGVASLDRALGGGLRVGSITEVCGPAGVGKSQICLGACVEAIMQRAQEEGSINQQRKSVIYIDTELKFDAKRLQQIACARYPELTAGLSQSSTFLANSQAGGFDYDPSQASHGRPSSSFPTRQHQAGAPSPGSAADSLLASLDFAVALVQPNSSAELSTYLADGLSQEMSGHKVRLLVIDSLSALPKRDGQLEQERDSFVLRQTSVLKAIAEQYDCPVLVSNQVSQSFPGLAAGGGEAVPHDLIFDAGTGMAYRPLLGEVWQHCASTRIMLTTTQDRASEAEAGSMRRRLVLEKSPLVNTTGVVLPCCIGNQGWFSEEEEKK